MKKITFLAVMLTAALSFGQAMTNADFATAGAVPSATPGNGAGWYGNTHASITGGQARLTYNDALGAILRQDVIFTKAGVYKLTYTISSSTATTLLKHSYTSLRPIAGGAAQNEIWVAGSDLPGGAHTNLGAGAGVPAKNFQSNKDNISTTPAIHSAEFTVAADGDTHSIYISVNKLTGNAGDYLIIDDVTITSDAAWTGTTDTDWATATNWDIGVVPAANNNVTITTGTGNDPVIGATTGAVACDITTNDVLTIASGGSLIVSNTSTGNVTYNATVSDTNWHLMSSPVEGEGYDTTWVNDNLIDNTTDSGTNVGIATYINTSDADGDWTYVIDNASGNFNTGQGYSIKRDATGSDMAFTGTVKVDDASIAITTGNIGTGTENRWTLIGNPFSSYINVVDLLALSANATALEDSREAVYVWNGTVYDPITTGYIYPGQGFFVNSDVASTSIAINQDMLSHQTGVTFHKSATSNVSIDLKITDGTNIKSTEINYIADKTTGLDPRFDLGTFTGASTSFSVFSHLVSNSEGINFMRQALPLDYENQIVPIGINATAGKEITFTAETLNLPTDIKVFLEDRVNNTFTRLDETSSNYKVTLTEATNGVGRFYLHTRASALSVDNVALTGVSIFKTNASTLRITGLKQGKASLSLFNVLGKQVINTSFEANGNKDISLPKLATGVYFVKVQTAIGKLSKKIILE